MATVMKQRQAKLRNSMTPAERFLREWLIGNGLKVKSQTILGFYISDLIIESSALIVELDGSQHFTPEGREYDGKRTAFMKRCGFSLIRFPNAVALRTPELILKDILTFPVLGRKYTNKAIARANGKAGMAKRFDSVAGLPTMTVAEGFRSRRKT